MENNSSAGAATGILARRRNRDPAARAAATQRGALLFDRVRKVPRVGGWVKSREHRAERTRPDTERGQARTRAKRGLIVATAAVVAIYQHPHYCRGHALAWRQMAIVLSTERLHERRGRARALGEDAQRHRRFEKSKEIKGEVGAGGGLVTIRRCLTILHKIYFGQNCFDCETQGKTPAARTAGARGSSPRGGWVGSAATFATDTGNQSLTTSRVGGWVSPRRSPQTPGTSP